MNILYITSSFTKKGSASVRNLALVNGLVGNGAKVDVLTQDWPSNMVDSYFEQKKHKNLNIYKDHISIIDKYFSIKKNNEINSGKFKINNILESTLFSKIKSFTRYIYYYPDIDKGWIKSYNKALNYSSYDIIISSSDTKTAHYVAEEIVHGNDDVLWYQYWGDPWVDDAGTKGIRKIAAKKSESRLLNKADTIFYSSKPTLEAMSLMYSNNSSKMKYLPRPYLVETNNKKNNNKYYNFVYTGSLYYGRNILPLVEKINKYNEKSEIKAVLNIYGIYSEETKTVLERYEFIKLHSYKSYEQIIEITNQADFLVLLGNMKGSHQIPGKLHDYFGTNKTIVALVEDLADNVSEFISNTNRCLVYENSSKDINIEEIIERKDLYKPLKEYSSEEIGKIIFREYEKSR